MATTHSDVDGACGAGVVEGAPAPTAAASPELGGGGVVGGTPPHTDGGEGVEEEEDPTDPRAPPGYERDSVGRTIVPGRGIAAGTEVLITDVHEDPKLNGTWGTIVGRAGTAYFVHVRGAYGGRELYLERSCLTILEGGACDVEDDADTRAAAIAEGAVKAVRVRGMQGPMAHLNGLYRRAGISGTKFEQRIQDGGGSGAIWRDKNDGRWKLSTDGSTTKGWQPSHTSLLGQWVEDPTARDGTMIRGMPYPFVTLGNAAEHCNPQV